LTQLEFVPGETNFDYIEPLGCAQIGAQESRRGGSCLSEERAAHAAKSRIERYCQMKRYGSVIGIKPETIEEYKKYHAAAWPEIVDMIRKCNIRNYSIFLKDDLLFGYFEYQGTDFNADMAKMAADPKTQEWWKIMGPMQRPLESRGKDEWWASMEEVFHAD
jgi:L-rhamnose mutarotase